MPSHDKEALSLQKQAQRTLLSIPSNSNGIYTTDESGTIHLPGLATDTYTVKETNAPEGYVLDGTPQTVKLIHGETHSLTFYNAPNCYRAERIHGKFDR